MEDLLPLVKNIPVSFGALMPVINPLATSLILLSFTQGASDADRRQIGRAIAVNTVVLLTIVLLTGSYVLSFFGITIPVVQAAGGLILASMGWQLLHQEDKPASEPQTGENRNLDFHAKTFYPFTFPFTVGPGSVAVALTLSAHSTRGALTESSLMLGGAIIGILGVAVVMYFSFVYAEKIARRLGPTGTSALSRLLAFIVVCLGAQIFWSGAKALLTQLK